VSDMPTIVLATRNPGKTLEIRDLLSGFPVRIKNLDDFGPIPEVEEDGETFDDNAYIKASFAAKILGLPAMADDSGLVVEALGGAPGVYSARYAGEDASDEQRCAKLLNELKTKANRKAAFELSGESLRQYPSQFYKQGNGQEGKSRSSPQDARQMPADHHHQERVFEETVRKPHQTQ